jgi:hypothetical protein
LRETHKSGKDQERRIPVSNFQREIEKKNLIFVDALIRIQYVDKIQIQENSGVYQSTLVLQTQTENNE